MDRSHARAHNDAHTAPRRFREFAEIAAVAGPMAGQYLARREVAERRRSEVAQLEALLAAKNTRGDGASVLARLQRSVGARIVRTCERLRSRRGNAPATVVAGVGMTRHGDGGTPVPPGETAEAGSLG